ncbi:DUF2863 family protein [Uliginosibacterium sp. H3]|uniref:DUF2863 family protein n=1 Tax=Uliginosibacterium silvisoli TaxID=3114758 RepID=A0ABU6KA91_9RHOO|nr:DUF2863 family protein [Uliginosibacterium sp. H3]
MKRSRLGRRSGLPREAENLLWLATGLAESGSRAEDAFWDANLTESVDGMLQAGDEDALTAALDHLYASNPAAHDALADAVESRAESGGKEHALLITAPVLAWSRFSIPASILPASTLANLRVHLSAHVLAGKAKLAFANMLFSPDQLPQGYCETARLATELVAHAEKNRDLLIDVESLPETARFLSDVRYVVAAVVVEPGAPIFRWQERDAARDGGREQAAQQWRTQGGACLTPLLPGCATEPVLPDAYFAACRQADRLSRGYSIRASVAFLSTTLDVAPDGLRAVIAPFFDRQLEEYRIGFTVKDSDTVVHGVVWPLLGVEDDNPDVPQQIEQALRECGVTAILQLEQRFPMEYCDDCGSPMYPAPDGEAVHAELPEESAEQVPKHLH